MRLAIVSVSPALTLRWLARHRLMVRDIQVKKASAWIRLFVHTFDEAGAEVAQARRKSGMLSHALGVRIFVQEILEE